MAENNANVNYQSSFDKMEIDLLYVLKALMHRAKAIIACALVAAIIGAGLTVLSPQKHTATTTMYVNYLNTSTGMVAGNPYTSSSESLSGASSLVDTFGALLMHNDTLEQIIEELELDLEVDDLAEMIQYSTNGGQMIKVSVTSGKADVAVAIAKSVAEIVPDKLTTQVKGTSVNVVEEGKLLPVKESWTRYIKNGIVGALVGVVIACVVFVLLILLDKHVYTARSLGRMYPNVPLLTQLPDTQSGTKETKDAENEAYKLLRTYLMFPVPGASDARVIGVTSALEGEGKSTAAVNLARVLAEAGKRVVLLEGDMRHPGMGEMLKLQKGTGLSELLSGDAAAADIRTCEAGFDAIACGKVPANPSELLCSQKMQGLLEQLRGKYDYVLIDLPAVMEAADAVEVTHMADGMLVLVRAGRADYDSLSETMRRLAVAKARVLGFVFNDSLLGGKDK